MCLDWHEDDIETAEEARLATETHDAVCDHILMTVIRLRDDTRVATFFLPVQSPSATMFMYPCEPKFIGARGNNTRGLLEQADESAKIPCYKKAVADYWCPEKYSMPRERNPAPAAFRSLGGGGGDEPRFRSLGSSDDSDGEQEEELEQGKVCENADGSFTFTLRTSTILKPLDEVSKMTMDEHTAYLLRIKKLCLKALLKELLIFEGEGKLVSNHILPQEDGEVTWDATEKFMAMLYPALQGAADCDILVAIPPIDKATGKPSAKDNAAFTFAFHLDKDQHDLPILGLAHNLKEGTAPQEIATGQLPDVKQEYNYWIVANVPPADVYAHIDDKHNPDSRFRVKFPSRKELVYERCDRAYFNATDYKLEEYEEECLQLQRGREDEIFDMYFTYLRRQQVGSHAKMPSGTEKMSVANLRGSRLSPLTTTIHFPNYPSKEPAVPKEEMYAAIAAAKEGVKDRFGHSGWWVLPGPEEAQWTEPMDTDGAPSPKRVRTQAEMEQSLLGIEINPTHGRVTATALRKEIGRRVGPVTRSRSSA